MSDKVKAKPNRAVAKRRRANAGKRPASTPASRAVKACTLSFAAGVALCAALLALFALLLANTPLPLALVRPLACLAASAGAACSGYVLARRTGSRMLLCGLACGAFYAACQLAVVLLRNGGMADPGSDVMLPIALVLGGVLGGSAAALRAAR